MVDYRHDTVSKKNKEIYDSTDIYLKCQHRSPFQTHCDLAGGCLVAGDDFFFGKKKNLGNVEVTVSQRVTS